MATSIRQRPLFSGSDIPVPVGHDIIFALTNDNVIQNQVEVKFVARVHISSGQPPNMSTTDDLVGTFRTVPNNKGIAIFNFRDIIESFVSADHTTAFRALVKGEADTNKDGDTYPIHMIDKWSRNRNLARYFSVEFCVEYLDTTTGIIIEQDFRNSANHIIFNGYVLNDAYYQIGGPYGNSFGFRMNQAPNNYVLGSGVDSKFLTNMLVTQYVNKDDYGTLTLFRGTDINTISIRYKRYSAGFTTISFGTSSANGLGTQGTNIQRQMAYLGVGPANIRQHDSTFGTHLDNDDVEYYEVHARDASNNQISQKITYYINCPTLKGYEPIRLCWLNQWGGWDYYTFTLKSSKTFSTSGSTYNQLGGSWDGEAYKLNSYKGGKKTFRVNTVEKITMNTDYITEKEGKVFEFLINSPEVMLLSGYKEETSSEFARNANNEYVRPVRLSTKSITRKTVANDKLIQFTFEIELTKTLRTQSV